MTLAVAVPANNPLRFFRDFAPPRFEVQSVWVGGGEDLKKGGIEDSFPAGLLTRGVSTRVRVGNPQSIGAP